MAARTDATREYERLYRQANRERIRENRRRFLEANPGYYSDYHPPSWSPEVRRAWNEANKEKRRAHAIVKRAVRDGLLIRQPCEVCGKGDEEHVIHAHHDDYSKPLEVRWLCYTHHRRLHQELRAREMMAPK